MKKHSTAVEVLELFAEVHHLADWRVSHAPAAGGLEAARRAWRDRQEERGLCRSCKRPARPGRRYCTVHLADAAARASAWQRENRERSRAARRERYHATHVPKPRKRLPAEVIRERTRERQRAWYLRTRQVFGVTRCGVCRAQGHNRQTCGEA